MGKYWYKYFIRECPLCGRTDEWKERQYTPKPVHRADRVDYSQYYDYCDVDRRE